MRASKLSLSFKVFPTNIQNTSCLLNNNNKQITENKEIERGRERERGIAPWQSISLFPLFYNPPANSSIPGITFHTLGIIFSSLSPIIKHSKSHNLNLITYLVFIFKTAHTNNLALHINSYPFFHSIFSIVFQICLEYSFSLYPLFLFIASLFISDLLVHHFKNSFPLIQTF